MPTEMHNPAHPAEGNLAMKKDGPRKISSQ
jgi:hypothetical protein